ncbi:hypothetical protein IscW_ISCW002575 [Ixodes scapularis]|uniref:Uncharacterized protein n=1 Tax=Ixodes scapularis TaxID=6945 RepID=B7P7Q5_IXOSC|nr:hypothetical protein IscW_ISCW002575 [Ixodes scapularis]|eukprot:XP_002399455.1 hypothetical protein IscW_ISCW002575 [Ixodes scapularis]
MQRGSRAGLNHGLLNTHHTPLHASVVSGTPADDIAVVSRRRPVQDTSVELLMPLPASKKISLAVAVF